MKNKRWIWFFVVVIVLSLAAMAALISYNLSLQLKPEQLQAARELWREKGLQSYQLSYTIKRGIEGSKDSYVVRVRNGRVVSSQVNGKPEPRERYAFRGMDALFHDVTRFQEMDGEPGRPRTYTRAWFDEKNGAIRKYVRRVMGSHERTEIDVEALEPLE